MLLLFFSIFACNTSHTKWLIYSRSQHLTRLANDFPVFLLNRSKLPICSYYFFLFWPVTLQTLKVSSTAPNKASQLLSCLFCLTGRGYQYAHTIFFSFG